MPSKHAKRIERLPGHEILGPRNLYAHAMSHRWKRWKRSSKSGYNSLPYGVHMHYYTFG